MAYITPVSAGAKKNPPIPATKPPPMNVSITNRGCKDDFVETKYGLMKNSAKWTRIDTIKKKINASTGPYSKYL